MGINGLPWIRSVPHCATLGTVETALGLLHQKRATQLVITTEQGHAFATVSLKDLLWGLASRTLRLEQPLSQVPSLYPLRLLLLADTTPPDWWSLWKRLGNPDSDDPLVEYGLMSVTGEFLGLLDYSEFLDTLVQQCPDWPVSPLTPSTDYTDASQASPRQSAQSHASQSQASQSQAFQKASDQGSVLGSLEEPWTIASDSVDPQNSLFLAFFWLNTIAHLMPRQRDLQRENETLRLENWNKNVLLTLLNHDLKAPLSSILGLATLLKEGIGSEPGQSGEMPRQQYYSQLIYQSGRYLMGIINGLMSLSRLETGQGELNRRVMPLQPLLEQSWSLAQKEIALRAPLDTAVSLQSLPALDSLGIPSLNLWGDEVYTEQLLTALLTYALEQGESGDLRLALDQWGQGVEVKGHREDLKPWLLVSVKIPVETIAFGMGGGLNLGEGDALDYRLDDLDNLDWWIARRLAQWHGGDVNRFGAELMVLLPQFPQTSQTSQASQFPQAPTPSLSLDPKSIDPQVMDPHFILLGMDHPGGLDAFTLSLLLPWVEPLRSAGVLTLFAPTIEELTHKLAVFRPTIVLLDAEWELAWDTLVNQWENRSGLNVGLISLNLNLHRQGDLSVPETTVLCHPFKPLHAECFVLPQEIEALSTYLYNALILPFLSAKPPLPSPVSTPAETELPIRTLLWLCFPTAMPNSDDRSVEVAALLPGCQIIEAQDMEQAELLARIWEPQAIVLEPTPDQDLTELLEAIRQSEDLAKLRLVTWDELYERYPPS